MVLSQLASISTAVSGFAVTASLIYVGIQTKQNVRHTRALIHQGTAARTSNLLARFMVSSEYRGQMQLVAYFKTSYPGLHLEQGLVQLLAEYGLSVDFDFYYLYSDCREDS